MKKLSILILLLFLLSTLCYAQSQTADWQTYKGDSEDFSIEFPAPPTVSVMKDKTNKDEVGALYKTYLNKTFYFVFTCKNTECPQFEILKSLKFWARNSKNSQFTEKNSDDSGIEISFVDSEGFFQKIRQFKPDKYYFLVHSVSEIQDNPDVERFFKSFQAKSDNPKAKNAEKENFRARLVNDQLDLTPPSNAKILLPTSPTVVQDGSPKETNIIKTVTILSKPRANYTNAARIYQISGEVLLRVTFSAKEEINAITPLKKLPFGLTEQAIAAAKEITFKSASRNGIPISITKPVIYQFTIY